jgi:chromosome segregation ATPase
MMVDKSFNDVPTCASCIQLKLRISSLTDEIVELESKVSDAESDYEDASGDLDIANGTIKDLETEVESNNKRIAILEKMVVAVQDAMDDYDYEINRI